ncbi:MAG: hypothetical protein RMJ56_13445 [Gemmataceae bacterium]|nr:hypothetical protein [Gemmata sp.]MDW8198597.1 hypothetical protein [Gemmataceae bacterium]
MHPAVPAVAGTTPAVAGTACPGLCLAAGGVTLTATLGVVVATLGIGALALVALSTLSQPQSSVRVSYRGAEVEFRRD